jgi:hypothetical protein
MHADAFPANKNLTPAACFHIFLRRIRTKRTLFFFFLKNHFLILHRHHPLQRYCFITYGSLVTTLNLITIQFIVHPPLQSSQRHSRSLIKVIHLSERASIQFASLLPVIVIH